MSVITDAASAEVKKGYTLLYGTTLTRPQPIVSEGMNISYVVDVNVSEVDPTGMINQYIVVKSQHKNGTFNASELSGLPTQTPADWQLDDSLPGHVDTTLHNVPLSRNNVDLQYADIGAPVVVQRSQSLGTWEVTGFSIQQPGTHKLYPVDLSDMTIGTVIDLSISTRLITLAELGELQPFGDLALGASAIFKGDTLLNIV